ncbi:thyroid receptor-interacting protein 11-like isoform X4 [Ostrea edulis]|uniref:thyroid receptor-interacting protein 11-like isoform X4 n=1 Tax=Ostrea edulis TaxID=37623 RepID=UPI0020958641|nr:thyroid receptor-interacting protein 11-like isoform X4 [Ostrea edulis]
MSWLGGSLTSITGQLSNLTKDILTEGTQEVSDHATELRISQEKNAECLNTISAIKTENERLKRLSHELEEKAESAELQINKISNQYRQMLEEKEREINELKHSHEELLQQQQATFTQQDSQGGMSPTSPKDGHPLGFDHGQFTSDGLDFGDNISMQHEINRLMSEVKRLKAENKHWRSTSGAKEGKTPEVEKEHVALQDSIQGLKEQLRHEKEHHQQETVLLQDMHSQKITALHKKFKAEIAQYKEKVQELEQSAGYDGNLSELEVRLGELQKDHDALNTEKSKMDSLIQSYKQQLQEKDQELSALKLENEKVSTRLHNAKYQLLDQLDANHAQSIDLMCDLQEMRRNITQNTIARRNVLLKERQELVNLMIESGLQQKNISMSVEILEAEREQVSLENEHMLSEMGNTEHQALTKEIIDSFEKENVVLKKKNLELQEQIAVLEKAVKTLSEDKHKSKLNEVEKADDEEDYDWNTAEIEELSSRNSELEKQLKEQSSNQERDMEEFEMLKADWILEKEALENTLFELEQKLKERETALNKIEAQKEKLEKELSALKLDMVTGDKDGALSRDIEEQKTLIASLQEEKEGLETSLEELDSQHEEAMAQVIEIRNDLQRRLLKSEKENDEKDSQINELEKTVNRLQKEAQQLDDLEEEVFNLRENKEQLETQLKSLSSKRNSDQSSNGCEMCKELRQQQEKAAMTVNELHMDVKELEDKLQKSQDDIKDKVVKIKQARESNQELQKSVEDLTHNLHDQEDEVKRLREESVKTIKSEVEVLQEQLSEKSEEMKSVVIELEEVNSHLAEYMDRHTKLQMENSELICKLSERDNHILENRENASQVKDQNQELSEKFEESSRQIEELQRNIDQMEKKNTDLSTKLTESEKNVQDFKNGISQKENELQNLNTQMEALRGEKNNVQKELDELEGVLQQKTKHYEHYIQELKKGQESDSSSLQLERNRLLQEAHEKDMNNLKLEEEIKSLQSNLSETKETLQSSIDGQQGVAGILEENERLIKELKEENSHLSHENDSLQVVVKEQEENLQKMEAVEQELNTLKEERNTLKEELRKSKQTLENKAEKEVMQAQTLEVITELESELSMSTEKIVSLEKELKQLKETIVENDNEIKELNERNQDYLEKAEEKTKSFNQLKSSVEEKDQVIATLEKELHDERETISKHETGIKELNERNLGHLKEAEEKAKIMNQLETSVALLNQSVSEKDEAIGGLQKKLVRAQSLVEAEKQHLLEVDEESLAVELSKPQYLAIEEKPHMEPPKMESKTQSEDKDSNQEHTHFEHQHLDIEVLAKENRCLQAENEELKVKFEEDLNSYSERVIELQDENEKLKLHLAEKTDEYNKLCEINEEEVKLCKSTQSTVEDQAMEISSLKYQLMQTEQYDSKMAHSQNSFSGYEYTKDYINGSEKMQEEIITPEKSLSLSNGNQSSGISESEEMEKLQAFLKEKDSVISELQNNNSSLLKMLETKSLSSLGDKTLVDVHRLENEVKQLKLEREQILAVMNEKSREASNLKSEVHRLTNIIAAEKVAINKLQKDNQDLTQNREKSVVEDMQKEALQNLSRIICDKDMEIEALTSKNETLVAVMQESSDSGSQINSLMQDKANLNKQLTDLKSEREQMITYLNQKHQESVAYHTEIQRLTEYINIETEKHQALQQNYAALVPQFEEKNENLLKVQNELINYKQKFQDLEIKCSELDQRMNASETVDSLTHNSKLEEIKRLQEKQKELLDSLKEKEIKCQTLHQQNSEYEESLSKQTMEISSLKKQLDNMTFKLQGLQSELSDEGSEKTGLEHQVVEQMSNIQILKESNNHLTLSLQEKEFEVNSLHEKVRTLQAVIQNKEGEKGQVNKLMQENESILGQARQLQQERDQAIMALKQRQSEQTGLLQEIQKLKEKDSKNQKELERLRGHLIQLEDSYTQEALDAEEREKDLRNRLAVAEETAMSSSSQMETASQQASQQTASLQQQLHLLAGQRDQAYLQVSSLQDQCQQYAVSLNNLQLVLEQFQQEKDAQLSLEMERNQNEIVILKEQVGSLQADLNTTKEKLADAEEGLEAASRLTEQLDRKEEALLALKEEVQNREKSLKAAEDDLHNLRISTDNKVDKLVIKNMLMGYFLSPKSKQSEVLRAVGGILSFTEDDFNKITGASKSWVTGLLRLGGSPAPVTPSTPTRAVPEPTPSTPKAESSFSELFVKFLETESSPTPPVLRLPAEDMARDVQRQKQAQKDSYNPFTAPRHVSIPAGDSTDHRNSPILMSGAPLSPMTLFAPVTTPQPLSGTAQATSQNTSSAILKNVLETR